MLTPENSSDIQPPQISTDSIVLVTIHRNSIIDQPVERPEFNPLTMTEPTEWMPYGNCDPSTSAIFFSNEPNDIDAAKAICAGCIVRSQCLNYALNNREEYGTWGGVSEKDRRRMQKNLQKNR